MKRVIFALLIISVVTSAQGEYLPVFGGLGYDEATDSGYKASNDAGPCAFVNDAGTAVGTMTKVEADNPGPRAVRWNSFSAVELGGVSEDFTDEEGEIYAINHAGTAAGTSPPYAVRWDNSNTFATELESFIGWYQGLGYNYAKAYAINNADIACGFYEKYGLAWVEWPFGGSWNRSENVDLGSRAVRWDASGAATELGNLGLGIREMYSWGSFLDYRGYTNVYAYAINESGTIVGTAAKWGNGSIIGQMRQSCGYRAVRWDASSTIATELANLGVLYRVDGNYTNASAVAINKAGTAVGQATKYEEEVDVGWRAVRWDASGTAATELGHLGTDSTGNTGTIEARAINLAGTTVGVAEKFVDGNDLGLRAVRWDASGTDATELGNLGTGSSTVDPEYTDTETYGYTRAEVYAINDVGIAVGYAWKFVDDNSVGYVVRAVLWEPNGVAVELNTLIDPSSGWTLKYAYSISNTGWIAGLGEYDPDGPGGFESYDRLFLLKITVIAPSTPTGVSASDGSYTNKVRVTWNYVSDATAYEVWRSTDSNSNLASKLGDSNTSPFDDSNVTPGTTYYYWVKTKNSYGTSDFSSSDSGFSVSTTRIIGLSGNLVFGSVMVGSSPQSTLTINNTGNSTMTVSGISYPSGFSGDWSGTIVAGGSHQVTVTFSPTSATSYGGTVTVNSNKTSGTNTIAASGTGTVASTRIISLSGNLVFGSVAVGSSPQSTLTINNTGNSTMTVSSISYPSGFSGNWSGTIAAGGSHSVTVTFSPTSATSYGGTVTVNSDKTSGTNTITASGTGIHSPNYSVSITKCTVTAGSKVNSDAISFSGTMNATAVDFNDANVVVTIDSNDMVSPCIKTFPINGKTFKKGKFNGSASNASFALDTKTSKFSFTAKNVSLKGLSCPLTVQIKIGDSIGTKQVDEDVVNGTKKLIPYQLMMGVQNMLVADKVSVKRGSKPNTDSLTVSGRFTTTTGLDLSNSFVITVGNQTFTVPGNKFLNKKDVVSCSKAVPNEGALVRVTAKLDYVKCTFTVSVKNASITKHGSGDFGIDCFGVSLNGFETINLGP